jgi:L-ascorbate metabolism protein UlaG (beta-lactamase superfamily)
MMSVSPQAILAVVKEYAQVKSQLRPAQTIPVVQYEHTAAIGQEQSRVTWLGHSAVYLEIEGKKILLDPMLGPSSSPFPLFNSKRYSGTVPLQLDQLGEIDAVILSHNHYDHLDRRSIMKLKDRTRHFYVPSGVAQYLIRWGVERGKISEHHWWDEINLTRFKLVCTPARHFSGRGIGDRDRSLWCSWVIQGEHTKIFFSGDSGYDQHFKEIGDNYGPFDVTLMECGQYHENWSDIHMMPEETVQAHLDVLGDILIPIHWGAFTLSLHAWTDPIERAVRKSAELGVRIALPHIGESVTIGSDKLPSEHWWALAPNT